MYWSWSERSAIWDEVVREIILIKSKEFDMNFHKASEKPKVTSMKLFHLRVKTRNEIGQNGNRPNFEEIDYALSSHLGIRV